MKAAAAASPVSASVSVAGSVMAGFPSPAEQYLEPPLDLNDLLVKRPAATYFVRVEGDSMIGAGIQDGDLLVVDRSLSPASGSVVIACLDGEFTVKRLVFDSPADGGRAAMRLVPENPRYREIVVAAGHEMSVFGVVTACIHSFVARL